MGTVEYGIQSWSYREFRARKNYPCENCGGIIPKGTTYLRHVVRLGSRVKKDPLRNVHVHLDCHAPWYHPPMDDRCRNLRQLPGRVPPREQQNLMLMRTPLAIEVGGRDKSLGTLTWLLPKELSQRMLHAPNQDLATGSWAEIEQNLQLILFALIKAAGNRRIGLKVSHALNELQFASGYVPVTNHDLALELDLESDPD